MRLGIAVALLAWNGVAGAVTADKFACQVVTAIGLDRQESQMQLVGLRTPSEWQGEGDGVSVTTASLSARSHMAQTQVSFGFWYMVATKHDAAGRIERAAYFSCEADVSACPDHDGTCTSTACAYPTADPFGADSIWTPLALQADGSVQLEQNLVAGGKARFGLSSYTISCDYKGTEF